MESYVISLQRESLVVVISSCDCDDVIGDVYGQL